MTSSAELLEKIRYHHLHLQLLMRATREVLTCRATHAAHDPPHSAMLVLLADLSHELAEHFGLEERGGYFDDIRRVAPQLDRQLGSLQSDHLALLERSRGLLELAGRSVVQPSRWDAVATGLADLLGRIDAHEHTENELIQRALMNDHGGSG